MEARKVKALHGWMWISHGWWLFKQSPLLWMVLTAIGVVGTFSIAAIPVIGDPLSTLLIPSLMAGYMYGCHALAQNEELELVHLFAGLKNHAQKLITLGGIYVVGQLLILGIMMLTGGATLVGIMLDGRAAEADPTVLVQALAGAGFAIMLGVTLFFLLGMAMQFAPLLVIFGNQAPLPSLRISLRAFLRNWLPMTVYGLLLLPFVILASLPLMLGWLILLPVIITSVYAIYRDLFPMEGDAGAMPGEAANDEEETTTQDENPS